MNLPVVTRWCDATPPGQAWETSPTYAALPSVFAPSLVDLDKCLLDVRTGVQSIKELRPDSAEFDAEARAAEHGLPVLHNVIVQTPRQVKQTQSAVARLATSVARSPGGQGSWFHRLLADTLARGFSGKAGLRDRAQKAAALLLHAQAQRSELLRDLAVAPVKITILCRSESVEPAYVERNSLGSNIFQSRVRLEEKKEWLAREGDKLRDLENRRDLIKLEEREIRELEKKTASGPGKLVANVHVACGCINAIKQEAKEMGGKMDAEQLVLEEALEIVKEVDGVIARGGWFPQVEVIQEGEAALVSSLQLYLSKVAEIYCKQEKSGWWKGKDEAD
ncbi:hypothetical protein QBC39DRAFT_364477 [Podospora conica]|nr:hypothetical protein QBC39DRAFT_364477 [Schizothecium conicum]